MFISTGTIFAILIIYILLNSTQDEFVEGISFILGLAKFGLVLLGSGLISGLFTLFFLRQTCFWTFALFASLVIYYYGRGLIKEILSEMYAEFKKEILAITTTGILNSIASCIKDSTKGILISITRCVIVVVGIFLLSALTLISAIAIYDRTWPMILIPITVVYFIVYVRYVIKVRRGSEITEQELTNAEKFIFQKRGFHPISRIWYHITYKTQ